MRKGRDGEKKVKKKWKITAEIVATTSLPVARLTATDCNAAARANRPLVPKKSVDEQIFNSSQSTLITSIICLFELGHANGFNGDIA